MEGNHQKLVERLMPKIVEKGEFKVVGVSCNTTMMDKDMIIPKLVDEFHHSGIREIKNRSNQPISYGIFVDPPNFDPEKDEFTWIAGVEVTNFDHIPQGMIYQTIPAHKYAVLSYHPKTDEINPYQFLYQWFSSEGYEPTDLFGFEIYNPYKGRDTAYTLYLPIK